MEESKFVAAEIKRLVAYSGGMLNWNDFVVLREILQCVNLCIELTH